MHLKQPTVKIIKRIFFTLIICSILGLVFRGWLYRQFVCYQSIGDRTNYSASNKSLIDLINTQIENSGTLDITQIIKLSQITTSSTLSFTSQKNEIDPNKLIETKTANCIGYASFFATTCNYIIEKRGLSDQWIAKPQIGQIYFLGKNAHHYFESEFFKDHDFVIIENKTTGETMAVDPSLAAYLLINFVTIYK